MGYRKSLYSASTNCVEVNMDTDDGSVKVRDSKNPGGTELTFTHAQWQALIGDIKADNTDSPEIAIADDGAAVLSQDGGKLEFTAQEWAAFTKGTKAGEFDK